jgi:thiamine pyrophosphate-dependent acetolactate synthase large subunit-like protein
MDLYEAFRRTLQEAEFLLAVGTSFPDKHINSAIKAFLRRDNTHLYLVDPNLSPEVLHERLGEHDTIKPVIKMGFKEFVEALERLEQEEESSSSATPETQEDKNE